MLGAWSSGEMDFSFWSEVAAQSHEHGVEVWSWLEAAPLDYLWCHGIPLIVGSFETRRRCEGPSDDSHQDHGVWSPPSEAKTKTARLTNITAK